MQIDSENHLCVLCSFLNYLMSPVKCADVLFSRALVIVAVTLCCAGSSYQLAGPCMPCPWDATNCDPIVKVPMNIFVFHPGLWYCKSTLHVHLQNFFFNSVEKTYNNSIVVR